MATSDAMRGGGAECCPLSVLVPGGPCRTADFSIAVLAQEIGIAFDTANEIAAATDSFSDDDREYPNPVRAWLRRLVRP